MTAILSSHAPPTNIPSFIPYYSSPSSHYDHSLCYYVVISPTAELQQYNPRAQFLAYPDQLFWRLLSKKSRWEGRIGDPPPLDQPIYETLV